MTRSNIGKQPTHKFSQHKEYLLSHNELTINQQPSYFKGNTKDREESLKVLDHMISIKKKVQF
jgi:hypothetical protein